MVLHHPNSVQSTGLRPEMLVEIYKSLPNV
jgi:hypothetical protein